MVCGTVIQEVKTSNVAREVRREKDEGRGKEGGEVGEEARHLASRVVEEGGRQEEWRRGALGECAGEQLGRAIEFCFKVHTKIRVSVLGDECQSAQAPPPSPPSFA